MPFKPHARGITASIRLTPNGRQSAFTGTMTDADGSPLLKLSVTAPPEDGKANKALIALLAKEWKLPKSTLSILSGDTHRQKIVLATGDSDALLACVGAWLEEKQKTL